MAKPKRTRQPYPRREFVVRTKDDLRIALSAAANVPVDCDYPVSIIIGDHKEARRAAQNRYYWLRLEEIAAQAWDNGRKYDAPQWHWLCGREVMPDEVELAGGEIVSKWLDMPRGGREVVSTTDLSVSAMAEYTTAVEAFGASMGVRFSADPMQYYGR